MKYRLYYILRPIVVFLLKFIYRIKIVNKDYIPKTGPVILVGNHKHNYDFISLISGTKRIVHFLGKKELIDKHGWLFKRLPVIPVDRTKKNKEAMEEATRLVNNNEVVGIFPEGTFNKTEYIVMPFKYGAVRIAKDTDANIVPFAITGEYKRFRKGLKITFGKPYKIEDKRDLTKENIKLMNKVIRLMKESKDETKKK
jgi:1-acyl-sn-glycerol-3-phosphate acyltransferase